MYQCLSCRRGRAENPLHCISWQLLQCTCSGGSFWRATELQHSWQRRREHLVVETCWRAESTGDISCLLTPMGFVTGCHGDGRGSVLPYLLAALHRGGRPVRVADGLGDGRSRCSWRRHGSGKRSLGLQAAPGRCCTRGRIGLRLSAAGAQALVILDPCCLQRARRPRFKHAHAKCIVSKS